jgi:hypothetical protein
VKVANADDIALVVSGSMTLRVKVREMILWKDGDEVGSKVGRSPIVMYAS